MLDSVFSSRAKWKVLERLITLNHPISLRDIERFTAMPIRSIQLAVKALEKEKVIKCFKNANETRYSMNLKYQYYHLIKQIFDVIRLAEHQQESTELDCRAQTTLEFSDDILNMMRSTRQK